MTKSDYSRLLDDEFLNAGGKVRVRATTRSAARILSGSSTTILAGILAVAMLSAVLTVVIFLSQQKVFHHVLDEEGGHVGSHTSSHNRTSSSNSKLLISNRTESASYRSDFHNSSTTVNISSASIGHYHEDHFHRPKTSFDDDHHAALSGMPLKPLLDEIDHHHFSDHLHDHFHEHRHPGDVVMEDHHIIEAEHDVDDSKHIISHPLLLCLPTSSVENETVADHVASNASSFLTTAQENIINNVTKYFGKSRSCHVVFVDVEHDHSEKHLDLSTAKRARSVDPKALETDFPLKFPTPPPTPEPKQLPRIGNVSRCYQYFYPDNVNTEKTAKHDDLILSNSKRVASVQWTGEDFFSETPFRSSWRKLESFRMTGCRPGENLLEIAARLVLVWRYGGITVDLNAPIDDVLMALSKIDVKDKTHAFLETVGGTIIGAPDTCHTVIFEMLKTISNAVQRREVTLLDKAREQSPKTTEHEEDDSNVKVFEDVLNVFCSNDNHTAPGVSTALNKSKNEHKLRVEKVSSTHEGVTLQECRGQLIVLRLV